MTENKTEQGEKPVELTDTDVEAAVGGAKKNVTGAGPKTSIYERPDGFTE